MAELESKTISELEQFEQITDDMVLPIEGQTSTGATTVETLREYLNSKVVERTNQDFNELTSDGDYECKGISQNAPVGQNVSWRVQVSNDGQSVVQTAFSPDANTTGGAFPNTYRRKYSSQAWGSWAKIAMDLNCKNGLDYENGVPIENLPYTAPKNGEVFIYTTGSNGHYTVSVNGIVIFKDGVGSNSYNERGVFIKVDIGDVVSSSRILENDPISMFYPNKGEV